MNIVDLLSGMIPYFLNIRFIVFVFIGSLAGLLVGAIPGLSVSMATALLVSITYSWKITDAMGTIMGVYVVGVFSGAISAILINIPGAPSSVATTIDGYPMSQNGESKKALRYAVIYSFIGSIFGFVVLGIMANPITKLALHFHPVDYLLLSLFGLITVGGLTSKNFAKGLISAWIGIFLSLIGTDSVIGGPRLHFNIQELKAGISIVPALVGMFGFAEVLNIISLGLPESKPDNISNEEISTREVLKEFWSSIRYSAIGTIVGALPGAGTPVASYLAYGVAKKTIKNPSRPFGKGAYEGIVASESANNACIGGALIPMLTLAIPGDAVTAIIMSVFMVHGVQPGPMFLTTSKSSFYSIMAGGLLACIFLLILGLLVSPTVAKIINVPKKILLPLVSVLCVIGSYSCNGRMFDVLLMILFGVLGFVLKKNGYPIAPITLGLVLGSIMDQNFRRMMSLASTADNPITQVFGSPVTIILLAILLFSIFKNVKRHA